jgi:hypothetical protein
MARRADFVVIGDTFTATEQDDFIEQVHETNPGLCVICLRNGMVEPETLLDVCLTCLCSQPGAEQTRIIETDNILSWPKPRSSTGASLR